MEPVMPTTEAAQTMPESGRAADEEPNYAHHGPPVLSKRDIGLLCCVSRWIATVRATERYDPNWIPQEVDYIKSRLFWRIRSGKPPLPEPPPTAYSCPWYELIEEDRPHWTFEVFEMQNDDHFDKDDIFIAQCRYRVVERIKDVASIVTFGSHKFRLWKGPAPGNPTFDGWFIQRVESTAPQQALNQVADQHGATGQS